MSYILHQIVNALLDTFFFIVDWLINAVVAILPSWSFPTFQSSDAFLQYLGWVAYFIPIDYFLLLTSAYFTFAVGVKTVRALLSIGQIDV